MHIRVFTFAAFILCLLLQSSYLAGQTKNKGRVLTTHAVRYIEIDDTVTAVHHLKSVEPEVTLFELFLEAAERKQLNPDPNHQNEYAEWLLKDTPMGSDTIWQTDPVTENVVYRVREFRLERESVRLFALDENWTFNSTTGKTSFIIKSIAPIRYYFPNPEGGQFKEPKICWFKYEDVKDIIAKYDRLHPRRTFAMQVWDDYFNGSEKPEKVK